ncbi:hypothetical protein ACFQL0_17345 [Haloplanus litoreus]|uniref:hypothetical protein n=1 Tax=Haloplanus litoreus TaxID=767515 RepID=UPI00360A74D4
MSGTPDDVGDGRHGAGGGMRLRLDQRRPVEDGRVDVEPNLDVVEDGRRVGECVHPAGLPSVRRERQSAGERQAVPVRRRRHEPDGRQFAERPVDRRPRDAGAVHDGHLRRRPRVESAERIETPGDHRRSRLVGHRLPSERGPIRSIIRLSTKQLYITAQSVTGSADDNMKSSIHVT